MIPPPPEERKQKLADIKNVLDLLIINRTAISTMTECHEAGVLGTGIAIAFTWLRIVLMSRSKRRHFEAWISMPS